MKSFLLRMTVLASIMVGTTMTNAQVTSKLVRQYSDTISGVKSLKIDGQFSRIEITGTTGNELIVNGKLMSDKQDDTYQINASNNAGEVKITIQYPTSGWTTHSGELIVSLPQNITLDITTTSGSIKLSEISNITATLLTRSGNIDVIIANGNITTTTSTSNTHITNAKGIIKSISKTGSQYIENIEGELESSSSEGELKITNVTGNVKTESTSGKQTLLKINGKTTGKAVNGAVKVSDSNGEVNMLTFAGTINIFNFKGVLNLQSTMGEQVGSKVTLTGSSTFKTTEGRIRMQTYNTKEELTFVCKSETNFIQAKGLSKKKNLKSGKGPIVITSESTTGGQVFN